MLNQQVFTRSLIEDRPSGRIPADHMLLLSALDEGWTLNEVVSFLAHGANDEGPCYGLTLWHPQRLQICRMTVARNAHTDALLESEGFREPDASS